MKYCEEYAALLDAFADGECSAEEADRVRAHLAQCPGFRRYLEDLAAMQAAFPDAEDTVVPDGFAAGVMAAVRADAAPRKRPSASRWVKLLVPLAACLTVVLAVRELPLGFGQASPAGSVLTASDRAASSAGESQDSCAASSAGEDAMDGSATGTDSPMLSSTAEPPAAEKTAPQSGSTGRSRDIPAAAAAPAPAAADGGQAQTAPAGAANTSANGAADSAADNSTGGGADSAADDSANGAAAAAAPNGTGSASGADTATSDSGAGSGNDSGEAAALPTMIAVPSPYARTASVTLSAEEENQLLSGYTPLENDGTVRTYVFDSAVFDSVLAALEDAGAVITAAENTAADPRCCLLVTGAA